MIHKYNPSGGKMKNILQLVGSRSTINLGEQDVLYGCQCEFSIFRIYKDTLRVLTYSYTHQWKVQLKMSAYSLWVQHFFFPALIHSQSMVFSRDQALDRHLLWVTPSPHALALSPTAVLCTLEKVTQNTCRTTHKTINCSLPQPTTYFLFFILDLLVSGLCALYVVFYI